MRNNKLQSILLILLAILLLGSSAWLLPRINQARTDYDLEMVNPLDKDQTELVAEFKIPTMALFTFRSLAINYLWIRADNLKNEGQFFDANYLARAICALQPNLDSVWDFQGWNMAYNISVEMPTAPERWEWVRAGYELLRDEGLLHAPYSQKIHWSLAWIFQHKIGGLTDDHNRYYKTQLAYAMMSLLTPITSTNLLERPTNQDIQALAEVPEYKTWNRLWEAMNQDPAIAQLISNLRKAQPTLITDEVLRHTLIDYRLHPQNYQAEFHQFMRQHAQDPAMVQLDSSLRATILRKTWKLDPVLMLELNNKYGPVDFDDDSFHYSLDWRTPFAHALYWGYHGLKAADIKHPGVYDFERIRLHRVVYHSLQDMYHYGNLTMLVREPPKDYSERKEGQEILDSEIVDRIMIQNTMDSRMFWNAYLAMLDLIKVYVNAGQDEPGGVEDASVYLARGEMQAKYLMGHRTYAMRILNHLKQRYPDDKTYDGDIETVVGKLMRDELESVSPRYGSNYVISLMIASYANYGSGQDEKAAQCQSLANQVFNAMAKEHWSKLDDDPTKRIELALANLRWTALNNFLYDTTITDEIKENLMGRLNKIDPELYNILVSNMSQHQSEQKRNRIESPDTESDKAPNNDQNRTSDQP